MIGKIWTSGNMVLIPDFPPPYTVCTGNLKIPKSYRKNLKLIGPILPTRPSELPVEKEIRKKLKLPSDTPVIFAPISGPARERAFLTGILRRIFQKFPDDYEVVLSLGYPNSDNEPIYHGNLTVFKWVPNRFEYLKACDMVISRAGHGTITQSMCYGKPMILIPTPSHTEQLNNAKQAEKLGVAKVIEQEKLNKENLLKTVQQTLKGDAKERLKQVQEIVLKYDGLETATKTIIEMMAEKD
jgi:UDP:flavonoid glycosyltransferase YjiC (YdhE family)